MKQSYPLEKILWSTGAVIMIAAMILALADYWTVLTLSQKYGLIVLPLGVIYGLALFLSFTQRMPFLRMCLYLIFGLMGPLGLYILLGKSGVILPLTALLLMLIPAVFETQKTVQVFCILYVIWAYFATFPFFPHSGNWILNKTEKIGLGCMLWLLPWVLPDSWRAVAKSWGRPLGALCLLLAATTGLFMSQYPAYLDWMGIPLGLLVLALGIYTHNRWVIIEVIFFYVVNVLDLSAKYFNHLAAWPIVLLIIGAGLMGFGVIYLIIHKRLAKKRLADGVVVLS